MYDFHMLSKTGVRNSLGMAAWVGLLLVAVLLLMHYRKDDDATAQLAFKAKRLERIEQLRLGLSSASEAEKSAVMAATDAESQAFAAQSRAASAAVDAERRELELLLAPKGSAQEKDLLGQFARAFAECQRIDAELLSLAVKNTNIKASSLAFGPAAEALQQMDGALSRMITALAGASSPEAKQELLLAARAQSGALRIQSLLPRHIAEESDQKMDELESRMATEDAQIRKALAGLRALLGATRSADLHSADAAYARFSEVKTEILRLSRQNTNVRSLTISLNTKRSALVICQEALTALEKAIRDEPVHDRAPDLPR